MIISFGEILLDTFVNNNTNKTTSYVGGAPFNVVYQASKMGNHTLFIGNIGKDYEGKQILRFFNEEGLDTTGLHICKEKKTLVSKVTLKGNERSFTFEKENTPINDFLDESLDLIAQGDIIHVGSFILNDEKGRDYLSQIITFAKAQKKILSFDINYREDMWSDFSKAKEIYEEFYPQFDIVKFSKEELLQFTNEEDVEKALLKLKEGPSLYLVTLGRDGSLAYCNKRITRCKSVKVNCVDSTGAGDAFMGAFLSNVDSLGLREMLFIPSLMISNLKFANIAGALATTKRGALSSIPSYKEVNALLEKQTFH